MNTVAVVDYGMGNVRSVVKALEHVAPAGTRVSLTDSPEAILEAERVVFPGQGAARDCMAALTARGLDEVLRRTAADRPFLGVCMGMQVLVDYSEENGGTRCLGVLPGQVRFFGEDLREAGGGPRLKIPHMGWNQVHQIIEHPLWRILPRTAASISCTAIICRPVIPPWWRPPPSTAFALRRPSQATTSSPFSAIPRRVRPRARPAQEFHALGWQGVIMTFVGEQACW
jgi:imidazole glycerol phosphate synthase glutamine amidotransferase subunit